MQMLDIAPEVNQAIPGTTGKSLFRLKDMSRIARYEENAVPGELGTLVNLFVSFVRLREKNPAAEEDDRRLLQFAALGTVADIMPLLDENRLIVSHGLESLRRKPREGIAELVQSLDLDLRHFTADDASWLLTPAINAAGRMGVSEKAVSLFLAEKSDERKMLAKEIALLNEKRKRLIEEICARAEPEAQKTLADYANNFAVFSDSGILPGLTGLVASRLVSRFRLPALVVSFDGEGEAKGSLRSTRGYNLSPLLEQCADLFIRYGGHDFAAGFSMGEKNFAPFLERFRAICASVELEAEGGDALAIDAEIPPAYLSKYAEQPQGKTPALFMVKLVDAFEPSGVEWAPLTFMTRGLLVSDLQFMGSDGRHVKLTLDTGKNYPADLRWKAVYWGASARANRDFAKGDAVDVVYRIEHDYYNGADKPQMVVLDIKRSKA
jgi:single-stranded-DNA-specific exonuclease